MSHIALFDQHRKRSASNAFSKVAAPHPYGIKPNGNLFIDSTDPNFVPRREIGLGLLACLEDATIFEIFMNFSAAELSLISLTSKSFYLFSQEEEFWKLLTVEKFGGDFTFTKTWQETYKKTANPSFNVPHTKLQVTNFYSDYLFHIWRCTSADLAQWNCVDNIDRRSNLSVEEFITEYFIPNKPVVLTDVVTKWPAYKNWTKESLIERYGDTRFFINAGIWMKLRDFFAYCDEVQEEMPMYLFDHNYGENAPTLLDDYSIPDYFKEDFFELLGEKRPSFRWLLAGPARSGATFHKDPNYTSAWNAVITGTKKWVMYPPDNLPPGVSQSEDGLEVMSPVSIVEWFLNFYEKPSSKKSKKPANSKPNNGVIECILKAGEIIFVPNTWWHTVINLEESIAVTQNFCNSHNIMNVLKFFEMKGKQKLGDVLLQKMEQQNPGLFEQIKTKKEEEEQSKMTFWQKVENDKEASSFSFNFGE